jgi:hypothetical protein
VNGVGSAEYFVVVGMRGLFGGGGLIAGMEENAGSVCVEIHINLAELDKSA